MTPEEKEALENGITLPETNPQDTETLNNILNLDLTKKEKVPEEWYTVEQLRWFLRTNNIPFFWGASIEKLAELCIEHKLI